MRGQCSTSSGSPQGVMMVVGVLCFTCTIQIILTGIVSITTIIISTVTAILKVMIMRVLIPGRFRVWSVATPSSPLAGVCGVSTSGCEIPAGLHGSSQHGTVQSEGNPGISLTRTQMGSSGMTT